MLRSLKKSFNTTRKASYLGYVTQAIINNLPPLLFIFFKEDLGISITQIAILLMTNFGVQMLVDVIAFKYVDKIGYRKTIVAAHMFSCIGLLSLGVLPNVMPLPFIGILLAMIINAIGGGLIEVLISPIVEAIPGDRKAASMSLLHSFYCFGHVFVIIGSTVFFSTLGETNWAILPLIWAVIPFINIFLFLNVPINVLGNEDEHKEKQNIFKKKIFWIFFLLMICAGASEQAMSQWSSLFAQTGLNLDKRLGDLCGPCLFALLMGVSRALYGLFGTRLKLKLSIMISGLLCIVSYSLVTLSLNPIASLIGCALCGFSVGIFWPGIFSLSAKEYREGGTPMFALLALAGDVGCAMGPGVVGLVSDYSNNLKAGLFLGIIFPILLVLLISYLLIPRKKNSDEKVEKI